MKREPGTGCGNCIYSQVQQLPPPSIQKQRFCLWGPPHLTMLPGPQGAQFLASSPPVVDAGICGQYERDMEAELLPDPPPRNGLRVVS